MVFLLALTIVATILIILWLFKNFAFPLRNIIEHINYIASGNFDSEPLPEINKENELGILTESFNQMQSIIQKQIQDLNLHKEHLKLEVLERTRELEEAKNQLDLISRTDELTKLPNRRDIREKIQQEANRAERTHRDFCFIFIDIDKFKDINDTYGHYCGDIVLKGVADIIRKNLRKYDYVARWGGEEFLTVLPETDLDGAKIVAERFRRKVAQMKIEFSDTIIGVTITLGVALYDQKLGVDRSIQLSDHALYKGKMNGRNQVVIWDPKDTSEDEYKMALLDQKAFLYASCPIDNEEKNDPSDFEMDQQNEDDDEIEEIDDKETSSKE
jgi:diguanylate cyclase (GGDEF)-like protein